MEDIFLLSVSMKPKNTDIFPTSLIRIVEPFKNPNKIQITWKNKQLEKNA